MPDIQITIANKIATSVGDPEIVCGNNDYTAVFTFDAEWVAFPQRTMRAVWRDNVTGQLVHEDTMFEGRRVAIPAIYQTYQVMLGVYAGDIRTTTPAHIPCQTCITDDAPHHSDPDDELYQQMLEYMGEIAQRAGGSRPECAAILANTVPFENVPEITEPEE